MLLTGCLVCTTSGQLAHAQNTTGVEIGSGTIGRYSANREAEHSVWSRVNFSPLISGLHTIKVEWHGTNDANIRFSLFQRQNGSGVRLATSGISNSPSEWTGELDSASQYYLGIWAVRGVAEYVATIESETATVNEIPATLAITAQPADMTVTEGNDAVFSVVASGSGDLSYQWFSNGKSIDGQTSDSLILPFTTLAEDNSAYGVQVSNGSETIYSQEAFLTVLEATRYQPYSAVADTSTWVLDGPAATLDYKAGNSSDGWGRALLRINDVLLVGGDFQGLKPSRSSSSTIDRAWLAALDANSGEPITSFRVPEQVNGVVRTLKLAPDGNRVYVGGDFGLLGLDARTGAVEVAVAVRKDNSAGRVFDMALTDTQIYIGGDFSHVKNSARENLARLSLSGKLDTNWKPRATAGSSRGRSAPVQALALSPSGNTLYIGGSYTSLNGLGVSKTWRGTTISMLAISTSNGSINSERFAPGLVLGEFEDSKNLIVHDIEVTANYIIIAWGGPNYLTLHQPDGSRLQQYFGPGDVQALQLVGDHVIVGHHGEFFGPISNPIPAESVISLEPVVIEPFKLHSFRIDQQSARLIPTQSWSLKGTFGVWAISATNDSIWIAGNLRRAGSNDRGVEGLARFSVLK